ncbi:MAG: transglutaminaseTgpA domain-containing protein [Anaerolineaceae bacterium]|nr:transglutaminaseTgpA domain-containing protein [Anaerolineaceae bacterium]
MTVAMERQANRAERFSGFMLDLIALALIAGILWLPTLLAFELGWEIQLRTTVATLGSGLLLHYALAKSRFRDGTAMLLSIAYGVGTIWITTGLSVDDSLMPGMRAVGQRSSEWLRTVIAGGIQPDALAFGLLVSMLLWILSYNAIWYSLRSPSLARVLLPPSALLFVNYLFASQEVAPREYAILFLLLALLLVARSQWEARAFRWRRSGFRIQPALQIQNLVAAAAISALALLLASQAPTRDMQTQLDEFQDFLQQDPIQRMGEVFTRLVNVGDWEGTATTDYYGGDSLQLGGSIRLGEQEVFWVKAERDRRYYWRSRVYEIYDGRRWSADVTTRLSSGQELALTGTALTGQARVSVPQTITLALEANRLIYTAPQPAYVSVPTISDLRYIGVGEDEVNLSVIRPHRVLRRGARYEVLSQMSEASANQLRAAGENYPEWLANARLPAPTVTERTRQLAASITSGTEHAYDAARAIENWLRRNITYDENITAPPAGSDAVDWFLFEMRAGYCTYSATAMVTLLRTLGIPSRLAAGFAQGEYDEAAGHFTVREKDAHTWVEVYFPGYGWVEFEPTSAQEPISRSDDPGQRLPTATPLPSPTPTETPLPTATPPPSETPTATPDDPAWTPPPTSLPSPSPVPSATMTATAVILPTPIPPFPQAPSPPLPPPLLDTLFDGFVWVVGAIISGLLLLLLLLFAYWWWEWRGMKGLSPISRAFSRLERYVGLIGLRLRPSATTEERRSQIVNELPLQAERPVTQIAQLYTRERYGPPSPVATSQWHRVVDAAWRRVRESILGRWLKNRFSWKRVFRRSSAGQRS